MNHWIKENEPSLDLFEEECKKDLKYELHIMKHGDIAKFNDYEIVAINSKHDERVESLIYITTHISHEGNNIHEIMEEKAKYCIAYDGMEIII